jgi:predicted nucleic acid-binding protein
MDVNLLLAWGWKDHVANQPVARWIQNITATREDVLMTSSISEIGFVRVSIQLSKGQVTPNQASRVLNQLIDSLGDSHEFLNDDLHGRQCVNDGGKRDEK